MEDYNRSRGELLDELADLRRRINEFNSSRQMSLQRSDNPISSSKYDNKGMTDDIYYKVFLNSPDIITISTLNEGRFIEVNEGFISKIGYERYEVIGKLVADLGIWQDITERERMLKEIKEKGKVVNFEAQFRTRTGIILNTLISADNIDIKGKAHLLCLIKDITEQKVLQNELMKLDRLNLVGEMATSIGHEIRNPITTVRGFLQLFEIKYSEDQEFLDLMIEELDRANFIITEFLSLAKDKMVELKLLNLKDIIESTLPLLEASARLQDMTIKVMANPTTSLWLDEKEIRQLVINLVHNGLEAMTEPGTATIKIYNEQENVVLAVGDQGCGIAPEDLEKMGLPFYTTKEKGTGLGLAVCYGIAKRHNARIEIETSSRGTTVYVRFPVPIEESQ